MDPALRIELLIRLRMVMGAAERGDDELVCEEGEAYLAHPDPTLDLVTMRPRVHVLVAEAYERLGEPAEAADHYRQALRGAAHLDEPDRVRAQLARAEAAAGDREDAR